MGRILVMLYSLDAFVLAVLTLGNCKVGETISSVAWALQNDHKLLGILLRPTIDWMFSWLEHDHCEAAWLTYQRLTGQTDPGQKTPQEV